MGLCLLLIDASLMKSSLNLIKPAIGISPPTSKGNRKPNSRAKQAPCEKPIKKIATDNCTELEDASNSFEMSTVAGIYASIENGAKIVMQATETKK